MILKRTFTMWDNAAQGLCPELCNPKLSNPLVVAVCYYKFKVDCFISLSRGRTSCANPHGMLPFSDDLHPITTQVFAIIILA